MASYLEINSQYRNRFQWPLQGEFDIILANSGNNGSLPTSGAITIANDQTVYDPISVSKPIIAWTGTYFNENSLGVDYIRGVITITGLGYSNTKTVFEIEVIPPVKFQEKYNYYINAVFRNLDKLDQIARITEYIYLGNNNAQVTLSDSNFNFDLGDSFFIGDPTDLSDPSNGFLFVPTGSTNRQDYSDMIIYNESLQEWRPIAQYDGTTGILLVGGDPVFWQNFHNFSIRQQPPNYFFIPSIGTTTSEIVLSPPVPLDNTYTNWFLRVVPTIYGNIILLPEDEVRHITKFDSTTGIVSVSPPFSISPTGLLVELSQYGYDNVIGLTWGFKPTQQIPVYKVKLNRLVLPNKVLGIGNGEKTAYQSHFYVELTNIDPSGGSTFNFFSNSPYATNKCLFRCSVEQVPNPELQEYVTLKGDDMIQTIRFRFDANMHLKILLANSGEIFQTNISDNLPPAKPNSSIQLNVLFEFTPLQ